MLKFLDISLGPAKTVSDITNGVSVVVSLNRGTVTIAEDKLEDASCEGWAEPKILLSISVSNRQAPPRCPECILTQANYSTDAEE